MCPYQTSGRVGRGALGQAERGGVVERMGSMGWEEGLGQREVWLEGAGG